MRPTTSDCSAGDWACTFAGKVLPIRWRTTFGSARSTAGSRSAPAAASIARGRCRSSRGANAAAHRPFWPARWRAKHQGRRRADCTIKPRMMTEVDNSKSSLTTPIEAPSILTVSGTRRFLQSRPFGDTVRTSPEARTAFCRRKQRRPYMDFAAFTSSCSLARSASGDGTRPYSASGPSGPIILSDEKNSTYSLRPGMTPMCAFFT